MQLPVLPQDKANHVAYGSAIAATASTAALLFGASPLVASLVGGVATAAIGVGKEILDCRRDQRDELDIPDLVATIAGGVLVCVPLAFVGV